MSRITIPLQTHTRLVGLLLAVSLLCGFFGELYAPSQILTADAASTAANLRANEGLFRLGFAAYLVEAVADVVLALLFYVLLRPVQPSLALLSAFLGLISTAMFGVSQMFHFAAPRFLSGGAHLDGFSTAQLEGLAFHFLTLYGLLSGLFMLFYGGASLLRGYLIYRSGYLPRLLGALLMFAGASFVLKNVALVLAPTYASPLLLLPMFVAMLSLSLWMFFRGVDEEQWRLAAKSSE